MDTSNASKEDHFQLETENVDIERKSDVVESDKDLSSSEDEHEYVYNTYQNGDAYYHYTEESQACKEKEGDTTTENQDSEGKGDTTKENQDSKEKERGTEESPNREENEKDTGTKREENERDTGTEKGSSQTVKRIDTGTGNSK